MTNLMRLMKILMMKMTLTSSTLSWKWLLQAPCWISDNPSIRSLVMITMIDYNSSFWSCQSWQRSSWQRSWYKSFDGHTKLCNGNDWIPVQRFSLTDKSIKKSGTIAGLVKVEHSIDLHHLHWSPWWESEWLRWWSIFVNMIIALRELHSYTL